MKKLSITTVALLGFATFAQAAVMPGEHSNGVTVFFETDDEGKITGWQSGEVDEDGDMHRSPVRPAKWNETFGGARWGAEQECPLTCRIVRIGRRPSGGTGAGTLQEWTGKYHGDGSKEWVAVPAGSPGVVN